MSRAPVDLAAYQALVGRELGVSGWHRIDQSAIDTFAGLTDDHQFIHVDPQRARATAFGGTIAHGFLTLSLLSRFAREAVPPVVGAVMSVNYGLEKLRFPAPVPAGANLRGRFVLKELRQRRPGEWLLVLGVQVEIEGNEKPAVSAEWLRLIVLTPSSPR